MILHPFLGLLSISWSLITHPFHDPSSIPWSIIHSLIFYQYLDPWSLIHSMILHPFLDLLSISWSLITHPSYDPSSIPWSFINFLILDHSFIPWPFIYSMILHSFLNTSFYFSLIWLISSNSFLIKLNAGFIFMVFLLSINLPISAVGPKPPPKLLLFYNLQWCNLQLFFLKGKKVFLKDTPCFKKSLQFKSYIHIYVLNINQQILNLSQYEK